MLPNSTPQVRKESLPDACLLHSKDYEQDGYALTLYSYAGTVEFTVEYPSGSLLPTDSQMVIDYGDGSVPVTLPLPFTGPPPYIYTFSYTFPDDGDYTTVVTINNHASEESFEVSVSQIHQ